MCNMVYTENTKVSISVLSDFAREFRLPVQGADFADVEGPGHRCRLNGTTIRVFCCYIVIS